MGFEVKYIFHPRKEEGGYDTETKDEKVVKIGKPFDDTTMDKLAASIISQLARRDIWVVDVEVSELVKREVSFKECKDGRGIILKNKRYSFDDASQVIEEDIEECTVPAGMHPHEMISNKNLPSTMDDLYSNPNKSLAIKSQPMPPVNQNKTIYKVIFDPPMHYLHEIKRMGLKFTQDQLYSVHQVVPHPTGKLEFQKIIVTDDSGRAVTTDEKYFTTAGSGLIADRELNFSGGNGRSVRKPKLAFEDDMLMGGSHSGVSIDDGMIPEHLLQVPDIRKR
jgi:hypothetical protein